MKITVAIYPFSYLDIKLAYIIKHVFFCFFFFIYFFFIYFFPIFETLKPQVTSTHHSIYEYYSLYFVFQKIRFNISRDLSVAVDSREV